MAYLEPSEFVTKMVDSGEQKFTCLLKIHLFVPLWPVPF